MSTRFERTLALVGEDGLRRLNNAHVAVVGLGGVGGMAAECLARSGVGALTLVDGDVFEPSNLNRQLLCTRSALGRNKAEVAGERVFEISEDVDVTVVSEFISQGNMERALAGVTHCVDAIDDAVNKTELIKYCKTHGIYVISAMGAGNRTDCDFEVCDVFSTRGDPFARSLRKRLRDAGVTSLETVCARTPPVLKSSVPASVAAPPNVMGAMLAGRLVERIAGV